MFLKAFQKTFYHCTLCANIFLANGWFYSFYGCKTFLQKDNSKNQRWRKGKFMNVFFQNSCKAIWFMFQPAFEKHFLSVSWISAYNQRLNVIVLCCVRFCCSGVFCGVMLFHHNSRVFGCSASVLCPGVPGFIVCHWGLVSHELTVYLFFNLFKLNELRPYYQKHVNQIILNRTTQA